MIGRMKAGESIDNVAAVLRNAASRPSEAMIKLAADVITAW